MTHAEVIIVGGGPAGSACAWKLRQKGIEVLLLDKQEFPRPKPCAGWITPRVLRNLELDETTYPHGLSRFDTFLVHYRGCTFALPTHQYAIRRIEFDDWLLRRTGVSVHRHAVNAITKEHGQYILDDEYRCTFLVGAGGTSCPVYRTFFSGTNPRLRTSQIAAMEDEFAAEVHDQRCHLWFSDEGLPGYSWFVPKANGYVNIGLGAKIHSMDGHDRSMQGHWRKFIDKLMSLALLSVPPSPPTGYTYYLRNNAETVWLDNAFIVGDAAGLATRDMGEGIGPAIESGIRAANAIIHHTSYSIASIHKYSLRDILFPC